jgi:hypothetical protein
MHRTALLLAALLLAAPGLTPPCQAQPMIGDGTDGFSLPEATLLRVDADALITAQELQVRGTVAGGQLVDMSLRFAVDRADLLKLRPPHFDMDLDAAALLSFDPDLPVWIVATPDDAFLVTLRSRIADGERLADLATELDAAHFPMLLDLENYTFAGALQADGGER